MSKSSGKLGKPRIFIGSSVEGLDVAHAVQSNFENFAECTVWDQNAFALSEFVLTSLEKMAATHDFGVLVFSADDAVRIRGREVTVPRDNVVFEAGMLVGRLGRERVFILQPRSAELHILSDLAGLNLATYDAQRSDGNLLAAVGSACSSIRNQIKSSFEITFPPSGHYGLNVLARTLTTAEEGISYSLRAVLSHNQSLIVVLKVSDTLPHTNWHYTLGQMKDWIVDPIHSTSLSQKFHLDGPTDSDLPLTFQGAGTIEVSMFLNGDIAPVERFLIVV